MVNTNYATGSKLGVKLGDTHTTAQFTLGEIVHGNNGSVWMYIQASASVTQYDAVRIDDGYKIGQITIDTAKQPLTVGFAQVAFSTADYGWVMLAGKPLVRLAADCEPSLAIYCTTTGGVVDDATTSSMIQGLVAATSVTGATTAATCVANFPTISRASNLTSI
jgi:hypothetical protein